MPMDSQGKFTIPVDADVDGLLEKLRAVDTYLRKLENDAKRAFNASDLVGNGKGSIFSPARSVGDVRAALSSGMMPKGAMPEVEKALKALSDHEKALAAQAKRGDPTLPISPQQAARQALLEAAKKQAGQNKPTKVDADQTFFTKLAQAVVRAQPGRVVAAAARGNVAGATRGLLGPSFMETMLANPELMTMLMYTTGYLAVNSQQASFNRQATALGSALSGAVPGAASFPGTAGQAYELGAAQLSGDFATAPDTVKTALSSLAQANVAPRNLGQNLIDVLGFSGANQLPIKDITSLVAAFSTTGGLNGKAVNGLLQDTKNVSKDANISLVQLISSMKALSSTAVGSARDVGGLAAVQKIIGANSGINAGALLSPALSSTGAQAIQQAALLGLSPRAFLTTQSNGKGGTALIYDRIASLVKRVGKGPAGTDVAEQLLTSAGLVNPQAISSPQQFADLIHTMMTGSPKQAEQAAKNLYSQAQHQRVSQKQNYQDEADALRGLTSATDKAKYALESIFTQLVDGTFFNHLRDTGSIDTNDTGPMTVHVKSPLKTSAAEAQIRNHGMNVNGSQISGQLATDAWQAAQGNPLYFSLLLGQMAKEATNPKTGKVDPSIISADGGYGLGQFTDPSVARKYLGPHWKQAALDPNKALKAMLAYDTDLIKANHGNVAKALAQYNAGPNGWSLTNVPHEGRQYGQELVKETQDIAGKIDVTVTVKHDGTATATAKTQITRTRTGGGNGHYTPPPHRRGA